MEQATTGLGQVAVFIAITIMIGIATWFKVRSMGGDHDGSGKDVFLAGGGLTWLYVAGSITLTNLSTEQLVGMNGNQMLLLAWWGLPTSPSRSALSVYSPHSAALPSKSRRTALAMAVKLWPSKAAGAGMATRRQAVDLS